MISKGIKKGQGDELKCWNSLVNNLDDWVIMSTKFISFRLNYVHFEESEVFLVSMGVLSAR